MTSTEKNSIESIVLDTSIFIQENFFHGKKIQSFLSLAQNGEIQLYITEVTYNEILKNLIVFTERAAANHKKFKKEFENWILKNSDTGECMFKELDRQALIEELKAKLEKIVEEKTLIIIPYQNIDIEKIFKKYFSTIPPFGRGDKKSEFPDAFSLELVNEYFENPKAEVTLFSLDKDMLESKYDKFSIKQDYKEYLDRKYSDKTKAILTRDIFNSNIHTLTETFRAWFNDNLYDTDLYYDVANWNEVYDISIESIEVGDLECDIISISESLVTVEITTTVLAKVDILTDDENSRYYDSDDKSYHYFKREFITVENRFNSSIIASVEVENEDDHSEEFEIISINDGISISFHSNEH